MRLIESKLSEARPSVYQRGVVVFSECSVDGRLGARLVDNPEDLWPAGGTLQEEIAVAVWEDSVFQSRM